MNELPQWTNTPAGEALSRALLHFLWQGAALGVAAAVVLRALRASTAQTRYGIACLFLLAMAAAPLVTWWTLNPGADSIAGSRAVAGVPVQPAVSPSATETSDRTGATVSLLWFAGVCLFALRAAGGWALAMWQVRKGRHLLPRDLVKGIAARMGIARAVRVYASARLHVPLTIGAIRPVIVFPASALTGLSPEQLQAVLAHELAHIARHDFFVNCLQTVIEALLYYHPAVWWLSSRIRHERELCCDAVAVAYCGSAVSYSRALLALEEQRTEFAMAASGGNLKDRIERLLRPAPRDESVPPTWAAILTVGIVLALVVVTTGANAQAPFDASAYEKWAQEDVAYIMTTAEKEEWKGLSTIRDRERFIEQFWLRRDPTPGTPANEYKVEHYRRIAYANQRFTTSGKPGWQTKRGRTYIQNGPPVEIHSHPEDAREIWTYADKRSYEFSGPDYETVRARTAVPKGVVGGVPGGVPGGVIGGIVGSAPARLNARFERINVDAVRPPLRDELQARLTRFVGQPATNATMERIREAIGPLWDPGLTFTWVASKETGNMTLSVADVPVPPAAPGGPMRIRVGANVQAAKLIEAPPPEMEGEGTVHLAIEVAKDGTVQNVTFLNGPAELAEAAKKAVGQWRYRPTLLNGNPIEVYTTVEVPFKKQ